MGCHVLGENVKDNFVNHVHLRFCARCVKQISATSIGDGLMVNKRAYLVLIQVKAFLFKKKRTKTKKKKKDKNQKKKKMDFTLLKTSIRKDRDQKPWLVLDQSRKQITLNRYLRSSSSQEKLIESDNFICIVPFEDLEYKFLVLRTKTDVGFNMSDIINCIVRLTIGLYKMHTFLNPSHYRCKNNDQCAEDVAQGYVLSMLYRKRKKGNVVVWYDFDH